MKNCKLNIFGNQEGIPIKIALIEESVIIYIKDKSTDKYELCFGFADVAYL